MAEFEIHITDFKVHANKKGWVSFWCKNNSGTTVPKNEGQYRLLVRTEAGAKLAENVLGQPGDFKPGDVVTMTAYVGYYLFEPGTYVVTVVWLRIDQTALVYDTKTYIIEPEVLEGKAVIVNIVAPSEFTPGVGFNITVAISNIGGDDDFFDTIINKDTGAVISRGSAHILSSTSRAILHAGIVLPQTTTFHGRVEAGHMEGTSCRVDGSIDKVVRAI